MAIDKKALKEIKESDLIQRCINASLKGEVTTKQHAFNTHLNAKYECGKVEIIFNDGENLQGDGNLGVCESGKRVFYARVNYAKKEEEVIMCVTPPFDINRPFEVEEYVPGNWEGLI